MFSRKEIQTSVLNTTRQTVSQIGDLVNEFINLTLSEINDPGWAFPRKNRHHNWSWLRRKLPSFATVSGTEDYVLDRNIDKIALIRQTNTPTKLIQVTDQQFYSVVPDPEAGGNPRYYRTWETEGVSTRLTTAATIDVKSSSTADMGDATLSVTVTGYVSSILRRETYALNGTNAVTGSLSWDANREVIVSKQSDTTGTIIITEKTGDTVILTMGPHERSPKFKVVSLYPIPDDAITMYVEYYTRIPTLENDSDSPIFDGKWHYVVRLGALAKTYEYLNKDATYIAAQNMYAASVRAMVASDSVIPDLIDHLTPNRYKSIFIHNSRTDDAIA